MLSTPLFIIAALCGTALGQMGKWDDEFDYSTYLEENQKFRLYWSNLGDDLIEFGIEAVSTGYIALGLSPDGGMKNSDIMLGWVDDDGVHLEDRHTEDELITPQMDATQNLELIEGEQENGITRIRFTRSKSNACDTEEDAAVAIGTSRVIYAYNDADPIDGEPVYHDANRGSQSVNLDGGQAVVVELEDDVDSFELLFDEWSVTSDDTEYVCKFLPLPVFDEKQHIVKIEAVIQSGNEGTVHHMVLYMCPEESISENGTFNLTQEVCDDWDTNMPSPDCRADRMQFSWAIGGVATYFPAEAGLPFGGDHAFKYAFLEVHYDNPELRNDIVDSSGLRLYHTQTLREHDISLINIGIATALGPLSLFIPPGLDTVVSGSCPSACTSQYIPNEGVTLFGNMLHAHTAGVSMSLRHIRDGQELAPIEVNDNYDFNFQQLTIFEEPRTLLPGDEFVMNCGYDTTSRDDFTYGGEKSVEEMCLAFVMVYPAPDIVRCMDWPSDSSRAAWSQEMYEAGYLTIDEATLDSVFETYGITAFGEILPNSWSDLGVAWNDLGDGAAMYSKLFDEEAYAGRTLACGAFVNGTANSGAARIFDFEMAAFEEFAEEEEVCNDGEESDETGASGTVRAFCSHMLNVLVAAAFLYII